jgi:hypothetical protein
MTNLGFEHLIEINPSKESWYQLCDHLATKPITMLTEQKNVNIISRTIENEFYHRYVNVTWHLKKKLAQRNEFILIGEASCVSIDYNGEIICFSRIDNPNRLVIWSRQENSFKLFKNEEIKYSSDLSCISSIDEKEQVKILCFVVSEDSHIYGMLCHYQINQFICSKWILINSKKTSFQNSKSIPFFYISSNNLTENVALYVLTNDGLPYITTCQQCTSSVNNWNKQWSDWMELTSKSLSSIESTFTDFHQQKIYLIALTNDNHFSYSTFDYQNHIPSSFNKLNNEIDTSLL